MATNVVGFCLGALWCGCSSPGDVLCMANELLVAPGVPAPLPSPRFLSSLKAFLGNRRLEITLLSDVLLKELQKHGGVAQCLRSARARRDASPGIWGFVGLVPPVRLQSRGKSQRWGEVQSPGAPSP